MKSPTKSDKLETTLKIVASQGLTIIASNRDNP
jgi:hypothetical protein